MRSLALLVAAAAAVVSGPAAAAALPAASSQRRDHHRHRHRSATAAASTPPPPLAVRTYTHALGGPWPWSQPPDGTGSVTTELGALQWPPPAAAALPTPAQLRLPPGFRLVARLGVFRRFSADSALRAEPAAAGRRTTTTTTATRSAQWRLRLYVAAACRCTGLAAPAGSPSALCGSGATMGGVQGDACPALPAAPLQFATVTDAAGAVMNHTVGATLYGLGDVRDDTASVEWYLVGEDAPLTTAAAAPAPPLDLMGLSLRHDLRCHAVDPDGRSLPCLRAFNASGGGASGDLAAEVSPRRCTDGGFCAVSGHPDLRPCLTARCGATESPPPPSGTDDSNPAVAWWAALALPALVCIAFLCVCARTVRAGDARGPGAAAADGGPGGEPAWEAGGSRPVINPHTGLTITPANASEPDNERYLTAMLSEVSVVSGPELGRRRAARGGGEGGSGSSDADAAGSLTCCVCLEPAGAEDSADGAVPVGVEQGTTAGGGAGSSEPFAEVHGDASRQAWAGIACLHTVHYACLRRWVVNRLCKGLPMSCPVCRLVVCVCVCACVCVKENGMSIFSSFFYFKPFPFPRLLPPPPHLHLSSDLRTARPSPRSNGNPVRRAERRCRQRRRCCCCCTSNAACRLKPPPPPALRVAHVPLAPPHRQRANNELLNRRHSPPLPPLPSPRTRTALSLTMSLHPSLPSTLSSLLPVFPLLLLLLQMSAVLSTPATSEKYCPLCWANGTRLSYPPT